MHRQGHGRQHEHDRAPSRRPRKKRSRAARTEGRLAARTSERARQIGGLAALQQDHNDQQSADQNMQCDQHKINFPAEN